jgi:hypothetical protein
MLTDDLDGLLQLLQDLKMFRPFRNTIEKLSAVNL